MKQPYLWRNAAFVAVLASSFSAVHAVDVNARIRGTVTDPSGAVVPNATVTATNESTGVKFVTKTQPNGDYLFPQLPVGTYTIAASTTGFKAFKASGILLTIDQEYVEKIAFTVGDTSETVSVQADSVQVNTTDSQLNNIVNASQMEELPLIGRNFTGLELILPGVSLPDTRFTGNYSVQGAQGQQSEYLINGADTNDIALNTIVLQPNLDTIDQFNLVDGPLNAEYDRNSGGIISATIKQGTNQIHGTGFEYYRDTFLNSNNFFQKTFSPTGQNTSVVAPYHQNIFGGTVGGPVLRDKFFLYFGYQGTHQRVPESSTQNTVYTAAQLAGNFSGDLASGATNPISSNPIPASIQIPGCTPGETWIACLGASGGVIPTSALNPTALNLVKQYVPAPNNNSFFTYNATTFTTTNQYIGRADYAINPRNQINVVEIYQSSTSSENLPFSGASLPGFGDQSISKIQQHTFDYVRQISSTAVNDFSAHYTRFFFDADVPQNIVQPSTAGFAITPQDTVNATIPTLTVNNGQGSGGFTLGGGSNAPQPRTDQVIQFDDSFSKVFGRHALKFGYDGRRFNVSNAFDASNSGSYSFNRNGTYSTGDGLLDFLLGDPTTYAQSANSIIQADAFLNYLYAQDSWRIGSSLTLNYGIGYSIDTPLRNHQYGGEGVACFIPGEQSTIFPGAPVNLVYPGDSGCFNSGQAHTRHTELGPRFGFAWAPDLGAISGSQGKFSVRGGFGIYYNRTEEESALQTLGTPPFGLNSGGAADFGGSPQFANPFADINGGNTAPSPTSPSTPLGKTAEANRFPYTEPVKGQAISFANVEPIFSISSFDSSFRAPYAENFQLSVEREFASRIVARLSYVGSLGRRNQITYEGNYETAAGHAACAASANCIANRNNQALLFPSHTIGGSANVADVGEVGSYGSSSFNALEVSVTKGVTHGLLFQASYTYAHALDNGSSFENSGFGENGARGYNQYVPSLNYGSSTYDLRHHFVFAPVYQTPIVKNHSGFSPISLALSGWEVSGILTLATGEPFDVSYAGTASRSLYCSIDTSYYACPDVPNQVAPITILNKRPNPVSHATGVPYFSPADFAAEAIGTFGNTSRDPGRGPGTQNINAIVAKNFLLSADGHIRLQLRMESDNVLNHTNLANPTSLFGSAQLGNITTAAAGRQTQLAGRIYF